MQKSTIKWLILLVVGAVATAATLIFPQIGFLEWFSLIPLVYAAVRICEREQCSKRAAWGSGFLTGFAFYFVLFHWLVYLYPTFRNYDMSIAASVAVVAAGWLVIQTLYGIFCGFLFLLFRALHKTRIFQKVPLLRPFVFAAIWTFFEWLTSQTWTGVPWGRLALGQMDMRPMLWITSVVGGYGITFLLVAVNALIAEAVITPKKTVLSGILAAALFVGNLGCGQIWIHQKNRDEQTVNVAVVQGNIGVNEKWNTSASYALNTHIELTRQAAADGAELIIWSETALPFSLDSSDKTILSNLAKEVQADLIVGAFYDDNDAKKEYNALYYFSATEGLSETIYLKRHLVPFGEYVPLRSLIEAIFPPLSDLSALDIELSPGTDSNLFASKWGKIGSLICFDSIYDVLSVDSVRDGAGLMVISSNDAWFYDSVAVYQHFAQAKLRAIETGRWFARSGNTGISAIVSPMGEATGEIEPLKQGYLVQSVSFRLDRTIYSRIGNLLVYCCIGFVAGVLAVGLVQNRKKKTQTEKKC